MSGRREKWPRVGVEVAEGERGEWSPYFVKDDGEMMTLEARRGLTVLDRAEPVVIMGGLMGLLAVVAYFTIGPSNTSAWTAVLAIGSFGVVLPILMMQDMARKAAAEHAKGPLLIFDRARRQLIAPRQHRFIAMEDVRALQMLWVPGLDEVYHLQLALLSEVGGRLERMHVMTGQNRTAAIKEFARSAGIVLDVVRVEVPVLRREAERPVEWAKECGNCGYSLEGLTEPERCPECGAEFHPRAR